MVQEAGIAETAEMTAPAAAAGRVETIRSVP
jgi:hypothetical protein